MISKEYVFNEEPYKSIIFLLAIVEDSLKHRHISIALLDEKEREDKIKKEKKNKIQKRHPSYKVYKELEDNFLDESGYIYLKYIKKQKINPSNLSKKLKQLKKIGAIVEEGTNFKITPEYQRTANSIIYINSNNKFLTKNNDKGNRTKLDREKDKIIDTFKKPFTLFKEKAEKEIFEEHLNKLNKSAMDLTGFVLFKIWQKWLEKIDEFQKNSKSNKIKKILNKKSRELYHLIYWPYVQFEINKQDVLSINIFYYYTGLNFILTLDSYYDKNNKWPKLVNDHFDRSEKNKKESIEFEKSKKLKKITIEEKEIFLSTYTKKANELKKQEEKIKKEKIEIEKLKKVILEYHYPFHQKLFEEIEKIKKTAFQTSISNPICDFERVWSETFFGFDYHLSIQEIFEIALWCFEQVDFFREMNEFQKEIIPKDCLKYLDRIFIGLGLENKKPSQYVALDFSYPI